MLQLYWAGRVTLCSSPDDLPRYDAAFESWFRDRRRGRGIAVAPAQPTLSRIAALTPVPTTSGAGDDEDAPDLRVAASEADVLRELTRKDNTGVKRRAKDELWKKLGY